MATVRTETQFRNAITARDPEIIVENDISLTTSTTIGYATTIKGEPGVSLFWASSVPSRSMFIISAVGNLTVESLILDAEGRDGGLVWIQGGKYTMNDGVILRNIKSTTSQVAVQVGEMAETYGGTFTMNGGLITGVESPFCAVFCSGGTVLMNNDASIDGNLSSGIGATNVTLRSFLTMTGNSRISNNRSSQGGSGGILFRTDIVMGVYEGDAPIVCGNRSETSSTGGFHLEDSVLTMRYGAEISDNYAANYCGGLLAGVGSTVVMRDNSVIKNNSCSSMGGGVLAAMESSISMEDKAQISNNTCGGAGGGIHLQSESVLRMKGTSSIHGNSAENGGGVYLYNSTAFIGEEVSSPEIYENSASNRGGGIFITAGGSLDLTGETSVRDNAATDGKGIYKAGILNLSLSPQIVDGLFFDDLQAGVVPMSQRIEAPAAMKPGFTEPVSSKLSVVNDMADDGGVRRQSVQSDVFAPQQAYTGNVPVIVDTLTNAATIQLELSGYVSPPNVPLVIADKSDDCDPLGETDRAAWLIPPDFDEGHVVILTDARDQVLIDRAEYSITYLHLFGAENPNPESYDISDLPIVLSDPGERPGYAFAGWYDSDGNRVTEISAGVTGDLSLTAVWEKLFLSFDGNAPCVCNVPKPISVGLDGTVLIPAIFPCRPCYHFIGWNMPASGDGKVYFPGDTVRISGSSVTLYAQWSPDRCCCDGAAGKPGVPRTVTRCVVSWDD